MTTAADVQRAIQTIAEGMTMAAEAITDCHRRYRLLARYYHRAEKHPGAVEECISEVCRYGREGDA